MQERVLRLLAMTVLKRHPRRRPWRWFPSVMIITCRVLHGRLFIIFKVFFPKLYKLIVKHSFMVRPDNCQHAKTFEPERLLRVTEELLGNLVFGDSMP